jgi:hypothetical protein
VTASTRSSAFWLLAASLFACNGTLQFSDWPGSEDSSLSPGDGGEADRADASVEDATVSDAAPDRPLGFAPPCYKSTDCPVNKLHCDLPTTQCVECLGDANCTVDPYLHCLTAVHRCVECLTEMDCRSGAICDPTTHICLAGCPDGSPCPSTQPYCDSRGLCVECRSNVDCAQVDMCDLTIGRCVFCKSDRSCGPTAPYCDPYNPGRNRCKECLDPSECPAERPYCDVHGRVCVATP